MGLEFREDATVSRLDERRVCGGTADQGHPGNLPLCKSPRESFPRLPATVGRGVIGDPMGGVVDIGVIRPAIVEHRLRHPFIGKVLEQ